LRQARKICREALDFASGKSNVYQATSNIHISFADLLLDTNQLAEASSQVRIGLEIGLKWTNLVAIFFCYMGLIRLQLCERNFEGAKNTLHEAEQSIKNSQIDYELQALLISFKVRLWLAQGDIDAAAEWLNDHAFDEIGRLVLPSELIHTTRARVMIALGSFQEAETLLVQLEIAAESGKRFSRLIEILALEAIVSHSQGKTESAIKYLERGLIMAEPEGYLRIFLDEGDTMRMLIEDFRSWFESRKGGKYQDRLSNFLSQLLAAY
jgi:LuxR family maltose regulon positive regulatory protein